MRYIQSQSYSYRMARGNMLGSCFVCSSTCNHNSGFDIFSDKVALSFNENPTALLSKILSKEIKENSNTYQLVCEKCFQLLRELDELQNKASQIKHVILDIRKGSGKGSNEGKSLLKIAAGPSKVMVENNVDKVGNQNVEVVNRMKLKVANIQKFSLANSSILDLGFDNENALGSENDESSSDQVLETFNLMSKQSTDGGFEILQMVSSKTLDTEADQNVDFTASSVEENSDRTFMCLFCDDSEAAVGDAEFISNHVKHVHGIEMHICEVCGQIFQDPDLFSAHLDEHLASEDGDFQCEVCNRIFNNRQLFYQHKTTHVGEKQKSARGVSDFVLKNIVPGSEKMSKAKSVEIQTKLHTCDICSKTFLDQQKFMEHVQSHMKEYNCDLCDKSFSSRHNLELHSIVHSVYKPFVCGKCGKSFARKAEIRDHERIHTGEKPYQCELCGRTFSQRSNLQSHKRAAHFDDRRYVCEECGKGFKRRRLLDYHLKSAHTGERPYKCEDCNATFVYPEHFKKHRRIHTGEKPFHCEVCGKAFNCRDNRNAHRFIHSDKKPYECSICGAGYMRKPLLYQHMQSRGHVTDTIILNTPRLITDDNQCITWNEDGTVEIVALDSLTADSDEDNKDSVLTDMNEAVETVQITNDQVCSYLVEGDYEEITASALADGNIQLIDTPEGQYQLIKVEIPNEDGEGEETWIKIEPE